MPITSSGQIALIADIEAEFDQTGTEDISLFQARTDAGLAAGEVAMTDFYGLSDAVLPNAGDISNVTGITSNRMTVNAYITNDGGGTITERGIYFGTSSNCTSNPKYSVAGTTGSFSRTFTGLSAGTTYYMRTYAINQVGEDLGDRCVGVVTTLPSIGMSLSVSNVTPSPSTGNNSGCIYNTSFDAGIYGSYSGSVVTTYQNMYNSLTGNCTYSCGSITRSAGSGSINDVKRWQASSVSGAGFAIWSRWTASGYSTVQYVHGNYYGPGQNGC